MRTTRSLISNLLPLGLVLCGLVLVSTQSWGQGNCYTSSIMSPTPFMGTNDEIFQLSDQSVWQVKYEYEYLYEYYPAVTICPDINKLIIGDKQLDVIPISGSSQDLRRTPSRMPERSSYVIATYSGCDYFVADGTGGLYVLEWYGGHIPSEGDTIIGDIDSYGFKDVIYNGYSTGRVWIEDYLLSPTSAAEEINDHCN